MTTQPEARPHPTGRLDGEGLKVAVVAARFNERIVDPLLRGAIETLRRHGVGADDIQVVRVPGAWELPQACEEVASSMQPDAIVAIGLVVRGETPHFDFICSECASGLGRVASRYHLPVTFGVLTCETSQQAEERAGGKLGNKGREAAEAALEMACLFKSLRA